MARDSEKICGLIKNVYNRIAICNNLGCSILWIDLDDEIIECIVAVSGSNDVSYERSLRKR